MGGARTVGVTFGRAVPAVGEEAALVAELQAGSEEAFAYLLGVYQHPIFDLVSHIVEGPADAADVLQDVFLKIYRGVGNFHGESSLKTWIYRIAVHEALNHRRGFLRRLRREPVSLDAMHPNPRSGPAAQNCLDTPYAAAEQAERQEIVRNALASLPQPFRTVVVLREIEGLTYEEIAEVLGTATGTVKSRLMRGRELLRRKLCGYRD
ncbi:MAG: RNA polymerase subunit sigma-24 [Acidobacteria bacterium]|nr:MAG: RNA polymerase subunit sigma-24 [Acidobacteriota bacterium]